MKKLLGLLAATGMVASTGASVIACNNDKDNSLGANLTIDEKIAKFNDWSINFPHVNREDIDQKYIITMIDYSIFGYEILNEKPSAELDESQILREYMDSKEHLLFYLNMMKEPNALGELMTQETLDYLNQKIAELSK